MNRLNLGISACLLGEAVRYDGGHKNSPRIRTLFDGLVEWTPVCPEVEAGLGVPRSPMHLASDGDRVSLVISESGTDVTSSLAAMCRQRLSTLADLDGFIFKSKSPSCAVASADIVFAESETSHGAGLFTTAVMARWPELPVCEESDVGGVGVASFVEAIFARRGDRDSELAATLFARLAERED